MTVQMAPRVDVCVHFKNVCVTSVAFPFIPLYVCVCVLVSMAHTCPHS